MGQAESTEAPLASSTSQDEGKALPSALVIVGPSGVGKGTLIEKLMAQGAGGFGFSCSHTTRQPRPGEVNGQHYHFTSREAFEAGIAEGKFLEHAYVHSNIYGTSVQAVRDVAASGRCCVLDIDVQGARQVRASGLRAIFVFISPPSLEELERRLRGRATDSEEQITTRLRNAREEMASVDEPGLYDYVLINAGLEKCYEQLKQVAERALAGEVGGPRSAAAAAQPLAAEAVPVSRQEQQQQQQAAAQQAAGPTPTGQEAAAEADAATAAAAAPDAERLRLGNVASASLKSWLPAPASEAAADSPTAAPAGLERWRGRVALVTGAGSGVGRELAVSLVSAGLRVVAVSRRKSALERLQEEVAGGGAPLADAFLPVVADVTREAEVAALPRIVARRWAGAGVDVLVNAAAVAPPGAGLLDGATAAWVDMVSTNVLGAALAAREAVRDMRARGVAGHVINLGCCAEGGAAGGGGGGAFFAATKQALRVLTEGLREEARAAGLPLRVTLLTPGEVGDAPGGLTALDVVHAVLWVLSAPDHVDVSELVVRGVGPAAAAAAR
eukprot:scaffold17.g512.t1